MTVFVIRFVKCEGGNVMVEYALLLAVVGALIASAGIALGVAIGSASQKTADQIKDCSTAC